MLILYTCHTINSTHTAILMDMKSGDKKKQGTPTKPVEHSTQSNIFTEIYRATDTAIDSGLLSNNR